MWQALYSLEQRVERLATSFASLAGQVAQLAQQVAQVAARSGSSGGATGGGGAGLVRLWLPTGIAAGTFGSPATATDAEVRGRSGSGFNTASTGTTTTVYNSDTTAVAAGKAAWGQARDDGYDLVMADC